MSQDLAPQIKTRMAPSPTGEFHIGSMRGLLYNYAFAKKMGGKFLIRIEDTDQERLVEGATDRLLQVIKDYGLTWDEGPIVGGPQAPYIQSQRLPIYKKYAEELVHKEHAYYCFCSSERLDALRQEQKAAGLPTTRYDKHCLSLTKEEVQKKLDAGEPYVIRLNVPANEEVLIHDVILGDITFNSNDIDDQVLMKSDGFPTYHLAVVVDDVLMGVTHIFRGMEWLPSTPKHVLLYKYFGWDLPAYGHLPLLKELGENKKLSKRYGSVSAQGFLDDGYLPEAILNFLMFLGWNPGTEQELYTVEEFVRDFSIEKVQQTDLVAFDRTKLLWFNGVYIRNLMPVELLTRLNQWSTRVNKPLTTGSADAAFILKVITLVQERMKQLSDFPELTSYFFQEPVVSLELLVGQTKDAEKTKKILAVYKDLYSSLATTSWTVETIDAKSHEKLVELGWKPKEAFMTLRVALTGAVATPPLFDIIHLLGADTVVKRLNDAIRKLS